MQEEADCKDTISQVHLGLAKVYQYIGEKKNNNINLLGNSIVVLDDDVGSGVQMPDMQDSSFATLMTSVGPGVKQPRSKG